MQRQKSLYTRISDFRGYTLLEMLAVVLILAIIVSIGVPYANDLIVKSREESDISLIRQACARYEAGFYIDGDKTFLTDGGDVAVFVNSLIDFEEVSLNYNNDDGFGAMPIRIENGFAYITYIAKHGDSSEYSWRLRLNNISFEDEAKAPEWVPPAPIIPEPAED